MIAQSIPTSNIHVPLVYQQIHGCHMPVSVRIWMNKAPRILHDVRADSTYILEQILTRETEEVEPTCAHKPKPSPPPKAGNSQLGVNEQFDKSTERSRVCFPHDTVTSYIERAQAVPGSMITTALAMSKLEIYDR
jgi:hypothetical protein